MRRCCCNQASCKICNCDEFDAFLRNYDFQNAKFTIKNFKDWSYSNTFYSEFGTKYDPALINTYTGYRPGDLTYNRSWFSTSPITMGTGSVKLDLSITGMGNANGEYTFTKSEDCLFYPNQPTTYLGEVEFRSILEFNLTGDIYKFFPVPTKISGRFGDCNTFPFGCLDYREFLHTVAIPSSWAGSIGSVIKMDMYYIPYSSYFYNCDGISRVPFSIGFVLKETQPITTGIFADFGYELQESSSNSDCTLYDTGGCPTTTCERYINKKIWSSCKDPFWNFGSAADMVERIFQYNDTNYSNQNCWRRCIRYENHKNFSPFNPEEFYLFTPDFVGCPNAQALLSYCNLSANMSPCENWNAANNTLSDDVVPELLYEDFGNGDYNNLNGAVNNTDYNKVFDPCSSCTPGTGTGAGSKQDYLGELFLKVFSNNSIVYSVPQPNFAAARWGSGFVLNTYNGFSPPSPVVTPESLYECSKTDPDIPNLSWSPMSTLISSAWITGNLSLPNQFIIPPSDAVRLEVYYD